MKLPKHLPRLQAPKTGYTWVYRGMGWRANNVDYAFYDSDSDEEEWEYAEGSSSSGISEYHYCEQVRTVPQPMSLEEQIALAKSRIGKRFRKNGVANEVLTWHITNIVDNSNNSVNVNAVVKTDGVCVYTKDTGKRQIVIGDKDYIEVVEPKYHVLKLNATYEARVYKDKIEVGCQTFPIEVLDQLKSLHSNFNS